jgi:hypothetical protein
MPPEQAFEHARAFLKLDKDWVIEESFAETKKMPRTVIAKWNREKPIRQALPDSISSFIATHVENKQTVGTIRIKCKGNETPDHQAELVTRAFTKPMEISPWEFNNDDHEVHIQCPRVVLTPIRFHFGSQIADSWQQVSATNKHRERLASAIFGERVSLKHQLFDDGQVLVYEMTPFAQRYVKPKDDRIKERQLTFPDAPKRPVCMPVECRQR